MIVPASPGNYPDSISVFKSLSRFGAPPHPNDQMMSLNVVWANLPASYNNTFTITPPGSVQRTYGAVLGVYVDNSTSRIPVNIYAVDTGNHLRVQAFSKGTFPIYSAGSNLVVQLDPLGITDVAPDTTDLLFFNHNLLLWNFEIPQTRSGPSSITLAATATGTVAFPLAAGNWLVLGAKVYLSGAIGGAAAGTLAISISDSSTPALVLIENVIQVSSLEVVPPILIADLSPSVFRSATAPFNLNLTVSGTAPTAGILSSSVEFA